MHVCNYWKLTYVRIFKLKRKKREKKKKKTNEKQMDLLRFELTTSRYTSAVSGLEGNSISRLVCRTKRVVATECFLPRVFRWRWLASGVPPGESRYIQDGKTVQCTAGNRFR